MAATPARLLPALRQPLPAQAAEFHHAFEPWAGTDRPPSVVLLLGVVQAWTLCAILRPSAGFSACYGISIAPHGLRPSWAVLWGCEGI